MSGYSEMSYTLTKTLSKKEKQDHGIYFTPPSTVQRTLELIDPYLENVEMILEPSCGSGEYLHALSKKYATAQIHAVELNKIIFDSVKSLSSSNISISHCDFLEYAPPEMFDLIIGNPPYAVLKKGDVDKTYHPYFDGRPNIFILFILKSLEHLVDGGLLSFVLPKNFLNCLYYDKTRAYIAKTCQILHIEERTDAYIETKQETILFIAQKMKDPNNSAFIVSSIKEYTIFGVPDNILKLERLYKDSTTLDKMGFTVSIGSVVWNQCKDILTSDETKTRLVYNSDISNNTFVPKTYDNGEKKNFINKPGSKEPLLVMNRGYGKGTYTLDYCVLKGDFEYLVENHLMCIRPKKSKVKVNIYDPIVRSLSCEKTREFIQLYFGNNAINTTEMSHILPIYK
jgi:hypothetical protein